MSKTVISVERVNEVKPHPDADRLDVVQVLGYQVITARGAFDIGDTAVYFPPDILIPETVAVGLGVYKYLKHAVFPGDIGKSQCRVAACRLRGLPSHGFLVSSHDALLGDKEPEFGDDVTDHFGGKKYEPPVRKGAGDAERESCNFPRYTSIENIQRYPNAIEDGTEVIITEKIHGTNVRMGLVQDDTPEGQRWNYAAGSHKVRRKAGPGLYWQFMSDSIRDLLVALHMEGPEANVIVYGEIFGTGVQDMDYGREYKDLRVFDISVDGVYLNYNSMCSVCDDFGVLTVPLLYHGPFSRAVVEECTYGPTTFDGVRCKFKDREGCVIKPATEFVDRRGDRLILKSVSADYRNRKGAKDIE